MKINFKNDNFSISPVDWNGLAVVEAAAGPLMIPSMMRSWMMIKMISPSWAGVQHATDCRVVAACVVVVVVVVVDVVVVDVVVVEASSVVPSVVPEPSPDPDPDPEPSPLPLPLPLSSP